MPKLSSRSRLTYDGRVATHLVLTVIGDDRPGLVELLSESIAGHGGNWLESRMSHLAGKFAGLLRASVPDESAEALVAALRALEGRGLHVRVESGAEDVTAPGNRALTLELVGHDRAGIVRDISRVLAVHKINVEEFASECASAPMTGETLFQATAQLRAPATLSIDALREALEELANELMVDVSLRDTPGD